MPRSVRIGEMMEATGVRFGTSGARGLVAAMTDAVCVAYALAFLEHLAALGLHARGGRVGLAGDLRPSTGRILAALRAAIRHAGGEVVDCGRVPTPALALFGLGERIPTMMVTGSHIPDDRNGIKFNRPDGEILKSDEAAIAARTVVLPDLFDPAGMLRDAPRAAEPAADATAGRAYAARYVAAFPAGALRGRRIGVYGHSSVGRVLLDEILRGLGADVVRLGWSETFVPVDTEAVRAEDARLARQWAEELRPFAIVSADGDADRPLLADEHGRWLRGDVAGILTARFLGADVVVCPVSCNTAAERSGAFARVRRTRIGSPYVVEAMQQAVADGGRRVVGFEANGGFMTASRLTVEGGGSLPPLPTRDAMIVHLAVLAEAARRGVPVSALLETLPARHTASDRLEHYPSERGQALVAALARQGAAGVQALLPDLGPVAQIDTLDGLRATFASGEIVHLRPSGNAPELRCYTEAASAARADEVCHAVLAILASRR